jgi:hypothetical protein
MSPAPAQVFSSGKCQLFCSVLAWRHFQPLRIVYDRSACRSTSQVVGKTRTGLSQCAGEYDGNAHYHILAGVSAPSLLRASFGNSLKKSNPVSLSISATLVSNSPDDSVPCTFCGMINASSLSIPFSFFDNDLETRRRDGNAAFQTCCFLSNHRPVNHPHLFEPLRAVSYFLLLQLLPYLAIEFWLLGNAVAFKLEGNVPGPSLFRGKTACVSTVDPRCVWRQRTPSLHGLRCVGRSTQAN